MAESFLHLVVIVSALVNKESPARVISFSKSARGSKGIAVAIQAGVDHRTDGMVPCDAAIVKRSGRAIVVGSLPIIEQSHTVMGGRPMAVAGGEIFIVAV